MNNKFVTHLRNFGQELREAKANHKVGLVLGTTGLGLSIKNYLDSQKSTQLDIDRANTEKRLLSAQQQSLNSLRQIHKALQAKQP